MDGSVLAVLAAYQNNLVTSKMMTSQVAQWFPTLCRENTTLDGKELMFVHFTAKFGSEISYSDINMFKGYWPI